MSGRARKGTQAGGPRFPGQPVAASGRDAVDAVAALLRGNTHPDPADGWAAAVTAGLSMAGARASLTSRRHLAALHESLYADSGKRLTYVLNVASRSVARHGPTSNAGHDDYHSVDDAGVFQLFAHSVQAAADFGVIAHRIAELSLTPGLVAHDTDRVVQTACLPDRTLIAEYLGDPDDLIDSPTPAQRLVHGDRRRRIPKLFDIDYPAMLGAAQGPDSYALGLAAQRPFYLNHIPELADRAFAEFAALTGRAYARVAGHWLDDAEYLVVAQGAIVPLAEAVCDHLRSQRWMRVGVLNLTMFRPFPADLVSNLLVGRKGVTVLERVDQPLATDAPLLREIRATMSKAVENGRVRGELPHPGLAACRASEVPAFYGGCYGLGGREVSSADLMAAVANMAPRGTGRRQFYLGVDFVRPDTRFPKQQVWQDQVSAHYPSIEHLALAPVEPLELMPAGAVALRVLGLETPDEADAITTTLAAIADVLGLHAQICGRLDLPGTDGAGWLDAGLCHEPVRLSPALERVTVTLAAGPRALSTAKPLADSVEDGALIVERLATLEETWRRLPAAARRAVLDKHLRVYAVAAPALRVDAAGRSGALERAGAFVGAVCRVSGLVERAGTPKAASIVADLRDRLVPRIGSHVAEALAGAFERGLAAMADVQPGEYATSAGEIAGRPPVVPPVLGGTNVRPGIGHGGRFWEQVGVLHALGERTLADPFAALGALPAATSAIRDLTQHRTDAPEFIADKCTGCGACWVRCPDAAIPGVVTDVADLLSAVIKAVEADRRCDRLKQVVKPLAGETRRLLKTEPFTTLAATMETAYGTVAGKLGLDPERRAALDAEFAAMHAALAHFPVARTDRYFGAYEAKTSGTGGLLSVTVNPDACTGCRICVDACEDGALRWVPQTEAMVATLRRNWTVWQHLPETADRYADGGDDPVASLLLKQSVYQSMVGGDAFAPGAAQKAALHLVISAVTAFVMPRARLHVQRLTELIDALDHKARELLASDANVGSPDDVRPALDEKVVIPLKGATREQFNRLAGMIRELTDLRWRYTEGPGGKGRAACGMTNDGSTEWGSTYPFNPYPFPWASHLLQDAPSVAIGVFEGQMRQMARGFAWVRRAELELAGEYDPQVHEPALSTLHWRQFTDDELMLCPPVLAVGGAASMLDLGLQNLSRLLASDRPVRAVVFDTPGVTDADRQDPLRRDLALLALAHRRAFVLQSSPATPSHLVAGVTRGLKARGPALFVLHGPSASTRPSAVMRQAKLALESRTFPALSYDPAAGASTSERLSLDGNPMPDRLWPTYELEHVDGSGETRTVTLPMTVADWAATEPGLQRHFTEPAGDLPPDALMRFDEYLAATPEERDGKTPFIYVLEEGRRLGRRAVSADIVALAGERAEAWRHVRQLAGFELPDAVRARVVGPVEADFERRLNDLEAQHRARVAEIESRYPALVARRLVEGLLRASGDGSMTVAELLKRAAAAPGLAAIPPADGNGSKGAAPPAPIVMPASPAKALATDAFPAPAAPTPAPGAAAPPPAAAEAALTLDPYIQSELCTSCDECVNINRKMFAYNKQKQAYIKDPKAGTFRQLVMAAQKCPVSIIHPGTPLNRDEPDLATWVEQAARYQ